MGAGITFVLAPHYGLAFPRVSLNVSWKVLGKDWPKSKLGFNVNGYVKYKDRRVIEFYQQSFGQKLYWETADL